MSLLVTHLDGGQTDAALSLQHFGAILTGSGILTPTSFTVSAQVAPDMTVKVSGSSNDDKAVIITDSGDTYFVKNTADLNVTILANATGVTKTDAIVLYVDLTGGDPDNAGSPGAPQVIAVRHDAAGTGTGAPTDGEIDAATNNNPWLKLREVTVANGTGDIQSEYLGYEAAQAFVDKDSIEPIGSGQIADGAVTLAKIAGESWTDFSFASTTWFSSNSGMGITPSSPSGQYIITGKTCFFRFGMGFATSGSSRTYIVTSNFPWPGTIKQAKIAFTSFGDPGTGNTALAAYYTKTDGRLWITPGPSNWAVSANLSVYVTGIVELE